MPVPPEDYTDFLKSLTVRELKILTLVVHGLTSKEIAQQLNNSKKTIEKHREHILQKANVKGRKDIMAFMWEIKPHLK